MGFKIKIPGGLKIPPKIKPNAAVTKGKMAGAAATSAMPARKEANKENPEVQVYAAAEERPATEIEQTATQRTSPIQPSEEPEVPRSPMSLLAGLQDAIMPDLRERCPWDPSIC